MNLSRLLLTMIAALFCAGGRPLAADEPSSLKIHWDKGVLTIQGGPAEGAYLGVMYLEAYFRSGSTNRNFNQSLIPRKTELVSSREDGRQVKLKCQVDDGVVVEHIITATDDEIDFRVVANNPTDKVSDLQWAVVCVRVGGFTGGNEETYLNKCFIFLDGKLERFPTREWATEALYTPGQVWVPKGVNRDDVNVRPVSKLVPSNGLIGCFSKDESKVLAIAFEPYQELFQGVFGCIHSDFRIGGLKPGETKSVRGKMYLLKNDLPALLKRYEKDFPEHIDAGK